MLNKITIMGRLTRDPELRRTNSGTAQQDAMLQTLAANEKDYAEGENNGSDNDGLANEARLV